MRFIKGFTLIEFLVLLAIIGVLLALLLPAISSARNSARSRDDAVKSGAYKLDAEVRIKLNGKKAVVQGVGIERDDTLSYKVSYVDDCGHVSEATLRKSQLETWRN